MPPKSKVKSKPAVAASSAVAPAASAGSVAQIEALAEVLRRHDLNELELESGGVRIYLRRGGEAVVSHAPAPSYAAAPPPASSGGDHTQASTPKAETSDGNVSYITSPFVGTFYRSPNPESAPFVDVNSKIKKGQVLCIIEAMKLMNEIPAEVDGVILQCLVDNGHPVEYGEPLFKIRQS